ncbi:hypothetical protein ACFX1X_003646 [Malus domestica]
MELFHGRWIEYDATARMVLKRKLMELALPQATSLVEPSVTTKTRGRPSKKADKYTHHDLSLFEIMESKQGSYSLGDLYPEMSSKQKRRPKEKVHRTPSVKPIEAIASLLGYNEDGWVQVRKDLLQELETYSSCYSKLYGSKNRVHELKHALRYFETHANIDQWMTMPDMGHIIASCYGVVLIYCLTFLPLRTEPIPLAACKEIAIGFTNHHFVQSNLIKLYFYACVIEIRSSNSSYDDKLGRIL